jgi:hypothetical protein
MIGQLASSRLGFELIRWYAFKTPHFHLHDLDGSLYMGRWWIVAPNTWQSRLLRRVTSDKYHTIRLHRIMRHDHDRDLHSHPFSYLSFILKGWYEEVYKDGVIIAKKAKDGFWRARKGPNEDGWAAIAPFSTCTKQGRRRVSAGDSVEGRADKFHRIQQVSAGGVWTMFCMSENEDDWGFLVDHQLVPAAKYLLRKGWPKDQIRDLKKDNPR